MTYETPGTSPNPLTDAEGDNDQLPLEDTLLAPELDDVLDEGYSPLERSRSNHWGETAWEESAGEPLDRRLREEQPEVWEADPLDRPDTTRAGRLVDPSSGDQNEAGERLDGLYGEDAGIDGAGASAEEAAVHWIEEP